MNNTISDLYNELIILEQKTKLFPNKYIPFENLKIINCKNNYCIFCNNYSKILYKGEYYHCCNDMTYRKLGWHIIYPETLELCAKGG